MSTTQKINFIESKAASSKPEFYTRVTLDMQKTLSSWQLSIFSFEWLNKDTSIKKLEELKESDQKKRITVEEALKSGTEIDIPILGIGIQDNIEIGAGKAVICTLAANGIKSFPAHIPKSNEEDFQDLLTQA